MQCERCKQEFKPEDLQRIFTGRAHYFCQQCAIKGIKETLSLQARSVERIRKETHK